MKALKIKKKLLPIKAHYFFINGAMSGVIPILPVYAGELGISAFAVGVIYTVLKVLVVVAKTACGAIADRFKNYKLLLILGLAAISSSMLALSFTPRPEQYPPAHSNCSMYSQNRSDLRNCTEVAQMERNETHTVQFWCFTIFITVMWLSYTICNSLSDAATYNVLQDKGHQFGRQRMFGSVGWGVFAVLTGYLNDLFSNESNGFYSYSPGFYLLVVLLLLDKMIVFRLDLKDAKLSKHIFKDVSKLIIKPRISLFLLGVMMNGAFIGFNWSYLYWYLRTLKANQLLLGLTTTVQCIVEVPFFLLSGWMIRKIGQINTVSIASLAFALRFLGYANLVNPWWTLPLELFQGPGFATFYSAITSYATVVAPEGTEATMQGLVGGTFEGLGGAAGSFLGGVGFGWFGGQKTYFAAFVIAIITAVVHAVSHKILDFVESRKALNKRAAPLEVFHIDGRCTEMANVPE